MTAPFLRLADGSSWQITGSDTAANRVVKHLAEAMSLELSAEADRRIIVSVREATIGKVTIRQNNGTIECLLETARSPDILAAQAQHLAQVIGLYSQESGAVLLHGALAEKDGRGVILAGHGEAGKTTASRRFPEPWRSLSDDTTLVVRDEKGNYRAHPFPTWSTFMFGGDGGTWDIGESVPLDGLFLLEQAPEDRAEPVGRGEATCLLNECAEQVTWPLFHSMTGDRMQAFRLQRFDNLTALTKAVPAYTLKLTLTGSFWKEIERSLWP